MDAADALSFYLAVTAGMVTAMVIALVFMVRRMVEMERINESLALSLGSTLETLISRHPNWPGVSSSEKQSSSTQSYSK